MHSDAPNAGREERRAQLERRRAAVVHQLRRLAIELADLDRQLDEIEQSERSRFEPKSDQQCESLGDQLVGVNLRNTRWSSRRGSPSIEHLSSAP